MTNKSTAVGDDDLIPASAAVKIACCSSRTLSRKASKGELQEFRRPNLKTRFYLRKEILGLRPKRVAPK